jgi:hypothetical protein
MVAGGGVGERGGRLYEEAEGVHRCEKQLMRDEVLHLTRNADKYGDRDRSGSGPAQG